MLLTSRKARIKDSLVEFVQNKFFNKTMIVSIRHELKAIDKRTNIKGETNG